jgi:hypothetical protein
VADLERVCKEKRIPRRAQDPPVKITFSHSALLLLGSTEAKTQDKIASGMDMQFFPTKEGLNKTSQHLDRVIPIEI